MDREGAKCADDGSARCTICRNELILTKNAVSIRSDPNVVCEACNELDERSTFSKHQNGVLEHLNKPEGSILFTSRNTKKPAKEAMGRHIESALQRNQVFLEVVSQIGLKLETCCSTGQVRMVGERFRNCLTLTKETNECIVKSVDRVLNVLNSVLETSESNLAMKANSEEKLKDGSDELKLTENNVDEEKLIGVVKREIPSLKLTLDRRGKIEEKLLQAQDDQNNESVVKSKPTDVEEGKLEEANEQSELLIDEEGQSYSRLMADEEDKPFESCSETKKHDEEWVLRVDWESEEEEEDSDNKLILETSTPKSFKDEEMRSLYDSSSEENEPEESKNERFKAKDSNFEHTIDDPRLKMKAVVLVKKMNGREIQLVLDNEIKACEKKPGGLLSSKNKEFVRGTKKNADDEIE